MTAGCQVDECTSTDARPLVLNKGKTVGLGGSDAELGGGVVTKRIGLAGRGKRGGARTLVAINKGSRWFFVFGFEKNDRADVADDELEALQAIAKELFDQSDFELDLAVEDTTLEEI